MRTFIRRSLWDVVPRDQRDTDEAFRRRQVVAAVVVLVSPFEPGGRDVQFQLALLVIVES